ncbi:hypothetical protein FRC08_006537 [Ceratobasidium sp. 394]|nr:hypothetical protein FRC08_006537 [Ceratobasidium sp. 394]
MHIRIVLASLAALASTAGATFDSDVCPPLLGLVFGYLRLVEGQCVCMYTAQFDRTWPPNPDCTTVAKEDHCEYTCPPTSNPSHTAKAKRNLPILMPDGSLSRCPSGMTACPLDAPPSLNGERATATM